jgi:hypothetical protein
MTYRRHGIAVDLTPATLTLKLRPRAAAPIQVRVEDEAATLHAGRSYQFDLRQPASVSDSQSADLTPRASPGRPKRVTSKKRPGPLPLDI